MFHELQFITDSIKDDDNLFSDESINLYNIQEFIMDLKKKVDILEKIYAVINKYPYREKKIKLQEFDKKQYQLTQTYVEQYKKDDANTNATVVIQNVSHYLQKHAISPNKNQIGTDLVSLGVKKRRKSHGYVYGLENTFTL
jgi:hypothetical protein